MPCIAKQPPDIDDDDRLLTEKQSAAFIGYGWPTWVKERDRIPFIRVGKFKRRTKKMLRRYQRSCTVTPAKQVSAMTKTDITDTISAELRGVVLKHDARLFRLEVGTLMMRNATTLDTRFFHDEEDAADQLINGLPPRRRSAL